MKYVFINPVTDRMVKETELIPALKQSGYERVNCRVDWAEVVREKYHSTVQNSPVTVIDERCPLAADLFSKSSVSPCYRPGVLPILLHCAMELSERDDLKPNPVVVLTPCRALAEAGKELNLPRITFMTAKQFMQQIGIGKQKKLNSSPVPLGFFNGLNVNVISASGPDNIISVAQTFAPKTQLIEMLYCQEGCHNGDGV